MKLYNSLTKQLEEVTPLDGQTLRIYSCGPTVYDSAHIGNLSAYIFADSLHRAALASGLKVKHVMNYTDVDDKTIARSQQQHPGKEPQEALSKLTDHYTELFNADMAKVGNTSPLSFIRATDSIEAMKKLITALHTAGFAYVADDGIYFSIKAYKESGKKYGQLLKINSQNTSEERIQNDEYDKQSVHDFALWKKQKPGEPSWPFSIDGIDVSGRPGWHIECSAMSQQGLGQPFDIHTGGIDLIFPHHENEIAQSTALTENPVMATIFAHNNHVLVDGKKMAKSANNFYTLKDIIDKGFDPLDFRLMILQTHYSREAQFSWLNLEAAGNRLKNWRATADLRWQASPQAKPLQDNFIRQHLASPALANNIDTPQALFQIDQVMNAVANGLHPSDKTDFEDFLADAEASLGLNIASGGPLEAAQSQLLAERLKARQAKDWPTSDRLREELAKQNIVVRDINDGQLWHRSY